MTIGAVQGCYSAITWSKQWKNRLWGRPPPTKAGIADGVDWAGAGNRRDLDGVPLQRCVVVRRILAVKSDVHGKSFLGLTLRVHRDDWYRVAELLWLRSTWDCCLYLFFDSRSAMGCASSFVHFPFDVGQLLAENRNGGGGEVVLLPQAEATPLAAPEKRAGPTSTSLMFPTSPQLVATKRSTFLVDTIPLCRLSRSNRGSLVPGFRVGNVVVLTSAHQIRTTLSPRNPGRMVY